MTRLRPPALRSLARRSSGAWSCYPTQAPLRSTRRALSTAPEAQGMSPPLEGLRVLDLTRVLAGPYASMLLADLGADVIKVERPKTGDDTRAWNPPSAPLLETPPEHPEWTDLPPESAYYLGVNRNKRSMTLDLKKGGEIVRKLVEQADVLVENYVPGKLAEMGLGYEDCKKMNPALIYCSITGYGQSGPSSRNPGYDVNIEAEAGLMHITGEPSGQPVKVGVAITDLTTGLYAKSAILAALLGRARTGKGVWIDANLFDSQVASLANIASNYLLSGQEATRQGTSHPSIVPYQNFPTKDGWIMIGAGNDGQFVKLCARLELGDLPTDEKFKSNMSRVANRAELIKLLSDKLGQEDTAHWLATFKGSGFPHAPVNNIAATFAHPQLLARGQVVEVDHPRCGPIKLVGPAVCYDGRRMEVRRHPPVLGEHTEEVLGELGYSAGEVEELRRAGVV